MSKIFRTHLLGMDDSGSLRHLLPPFDRVLADITLLNIVSELDAAVDIEDTEVPGPDGTMIRLGNYSAPVRYNVCIRRLFMWSYYVMAEDVPDKFEGVNVIESVIFALKTLVKMLEEESDDTLRLLGWLRGQYGEEALNCRNALFMNARLKLGFHLMRPSINRPIEATRYLQAFLNYHKEMYASFEENLDHWMRYPNIWVDCGEAFCLSGNFNIYLLRSHIHLSLALDRLQTDPVAQKEHTDWAVKQLRKAPTRVITKAELEQYLQPPTEEQAHPVLEALGGKSWLKKVNARAATGVQSLKEEYRSAKSCHACGVRDVQKPLSRCARCQYHYYCSKACQKADWEAHKGFCKSRSGFLKKLKAQKKGDPLAAQQFSDWNEWLETTSTHRRDARISALGVHRDPSRGHTHILMEGIKYTPEASNDPRFKFTIVTAGVFRIEDVLESIEYSLDLARGEGRAYVQTQIAGILRLLDDIPDGDCPIPMLILSMCSGTKPGALIGQSGSSLAISNVVPYNPEWRKTINGTLGVVPGPMGLKLQPDVEDAEKDFEEGRE